LFLDELTEFPRVAKARELGKRQQKPELERDFTGWDSSWRHVG
jgi:hypothetical protein